MKSTATKVRSASQYSAQAAAAGDRDGREGSPAASLYAAAVQKLVLLGVTEAQAQRLARLERVPRTVTFTSPIAGHLVEKKIVECAAVSAGERVMRIVDHGTLWLDAQVYEKDLPYVRTGQHGGATVQSVPGERFEGEIVFVHPHVDVETRTARVRVEVANPRLRLRPGMRYQEAAAAEMMEPPDDDGTPPSSS